MGRATVVNLVAAEELEGVAVPRGRRVTSESVEQYLERLRGQSE